LQLIPRREISLHEIAGWNKKNEYKRRSFIRRIENMDVSQEIINNCRREKHTHALMCFYEEQ
jgi:hypothetical protein